MVNIKNAIQDTIDLLPIRLEYVVSKNLNKKLIDYMNECNLSDGNSKETKEKINDFLFGLNFYNAITAGNDALSCSWIYHGILHITENQNYLLGATGLVGGVVLRSMNLYYSRK